VLARLARLRGRHARGAALVGLVAVTLASSGHLLIRTLREHARAGGPDALDRYEARLAPLRAALPRHGVIGYLSDRPEADKEFVLAQHALAPLVLVRSTDPGLIVGNFFDPAAGARIARQRADLVLLRDFGSGLMLFRRAS
jgi:hypothetical protein